MSLAEYKRKRDFRRTPEPEGSRPEPSGALRFVVHRHHASHLHWDVRLEMGGILASWAVPNGPPLEPGKKRLAVHTEDHPIEYLDFQGVIPDGYGAGTMTIWDSGTYDLLLAKEDREYKIAFHGGRLSGEWVLVKTGAADRGGRDWLMIRHGTPPADDPLAWRIEPMLAVTASEPFDSPDCSFEAKWDGVRTLAYVDGGQVRLQTRNLLDCTAQYPEAQDLGPALTGAYQAILDGEIVALDERGAPSFQLLQPRMQERDAAAVRRRRKATPVRYVAFDLLWCDGEDLRGRPLRERVARLDASLTPMGAIQRSERFPGSGRLLFAAAREHGFEGIVAKRLDSAYASGRSPAWVKVKAFRTMDCIVVGWTAGQGGRAATLGALALGIFKDGALVPVGHVGTGFDERTMKELLALVRERETPNAPFPASRAAEPGTRWCLPELVCEVRFAELTAEGSLRHPSFRGLRPDKAPSECAGEERVASAKDVQRAAAKAAAVSRPSPERVPAVLDVDGHAIRLTNLEKVLFPEDGYTKADLIRYYTDVSPFLLPWLRDRPLTLKPFPDGIGGPSFYQKEKPDFTPSWVRTWRDRDAGREGGIDYILGNDLATLIWLANYTAIEIHPWLSRVGDPDHPDTAIVDLDPSPGATWDDVREAAIVVRAVLDDLGLRGFPKTTGSRGIHVLVPIEPGVSFERSRGFVEDLGRAARERAPKLVTVEVVKDRRRGVYVDFLQNVRGKTTAGPYSVRPLRRAPVSAPLAWEELGAVGRPDAFTIATLPGRLARVGDLLAPALSLAQRLPPRPGRGTSR